MAYYSDNWTDKELETLEKRIAQVFKEAEKDLDKEVKEYFAKFKLRDKEMKALVDAGEMTKEEYQQWRLTQIGRGQRFEALRDKVAERYTQANETANAYVNDMAPSIYSLNRNYEAYQIEKTVGSCDFTMWDESTVRRLLVEEPDLMPYYPQSRALKRGIDLDYGKSQITKHVTSGIIRGLAPGKIANELMTSMTGMNRDSAVRAARTGITAAQNAGRLDSYIAAEKMGIQIKRRWVCTKDARTRLDHGLADGQIVVGTKKPFIVGGYKMMFPGDSSIGAPGHEIYNCRCTTRTVEKDGIEAEPRQMRVIDPTTGKSELVSEMTYSDWKKWKETGTQPTTKPKTVDGVNKAGTKMLSEAYEKHRIKNGMKSVAYDDLGDAADNIISANYGKLPVESAEVFNDTISTLAKEYDTPLQKIRTMTKNEFLGHGSSFAFVSHDYTVDSAELVINPVKFKNLTEMADRIKELSGRGYCVKIPDAVAGKYVATHEFAHTLINLEQPLNNKTNWLGADYGKIKKARKEIKDVYEKYMAEVEVLAKKHKDAGYLAIVDASEETWSAAAEAKKALNAVKLSDYSLQSADEFMAEAFANERIGVSSNPYSKEVLAILDKYFKG